MTPPIRIENSRIADSEYELNSGLFEGSFRPVKNHTSIQQRPFSSVVLPINKLSLYSSDLFSIESTDYFTF